ncbi:MAG: ATP-binding protein [Actinomycetota bacterium]|nr:ATP-binding protein [Actinomycetota bacterium]MED5276935.1 ATP-binding protein [Actinomycetota bacterium]|tara:strand:+ start:4091 stop:5518 length:1428 start_codon:yes stop_codon:yes gene_type:complete
MLDEETEIRETTSYRPRLGLQTRISLFFAVGGLLVSIGLAGATLVLTRQQLIDSRENAASAFALTNATRLSNQLTPDSSVEDLPSIVDSMTKIEGSQRLIRIRSDWLPSQELDREDLPENILDRVSQLEAGQLRAEINGKTRLVLGIPLQLFDAAYFAVVDLSDLEETLDDLRIILFGAGAGVTSLAALVGWWISRRTLRPLRRVGEAAQAIAGGRLDTRLIRQSDPDLNRLSESFNEMAKALEERIHRDARFASEVSHELRSPLTTLKASVGVLESRKDELSDPSQTALDLLSRDLERFNRLVSELLEISGYDAGAASLELEEVNLYQFIRAATRNDDSIEYALPENAESLVINVDKRRLARALSNLLDNANRYGTGPTAIEVFTTEDSIRIAVEDNGPGISNEERKIIFDRFSRGSVGGQRGDDGGTGLGLSLVQEDARLHGGKVWVEDLKVTKAETGSRFVIELPLEGEETL